MQIICGASSNCLELLSINHATVDLFITSTELDATNIANAGNLAIRPRCSQLAAVKLLRPALVEVGEIVDILT
jgi:hypothetical protein